MTENLALLKQPSAWLPLAMSLSALTLLLLYVAIFGTAASSGDERAPARIFQLLMVLQIPIGIWFAARWLPNAPRTALFVLALQAAAWIAVFATIWLLEH